MVTADARERPKSPRVGTSLVLAGGLLHAACGGAPTAPTAADNSLHLTGRYTLTLRPSARCVAFPDSLQTVRFEASLNQQDSTFSLEVQVTQAGIRYPLTLHGSVRGNQLRFGTADCDRFAGEAFKSDISANETFGMCGSSVATIADARHITGSFAGILEYYKVDDAGRATTSTACSASDHTVGLDAL